jgi:RND family efflux transporter MFP subunit
MKAKKWTLSFLAITAIFTIHWACSSSNGKDTANEESTLVKTAKVEQKEISFPIRSSGILSSESELKLAFKTGGVIKAIFADEGQSIKKGQVLAKLDLSEILARKNQAFSAYEKAKRDLKRVKKLYEDSVATYEQFQNTQTALQVAEANLQIAEFNLKHSSITAPDNGKILKRFAEENELISPGAPVFYFGNTGKEWVLKLGVTDREIIRLQLGDQAQVKFDAYPDQTFEAQVSEIAAAANTMTGMFEIQLQLKSIGKKLLSGFVGKVEIQPSKKVKYDLIPIEAFMEGDGKEGYVYTLNGSKDRVKKVQVKVGRIMDGSVAIASGLEDVQEVITDGAPYLTDNSPVCLAVN